MISPICPNCGSVLETLRGASNPGLACLKCGWNCAPSRQGFRGELLGGFAWLGMVFLVFAVLAVVYRRDVVSSVAFIGVAVAFWFWKSRGSWKTLRKLKQAPTSTEGALGMPSAPVAFANLLPSREQAQDIFGVLLNVPKPRPLRWNWRIKLAVTLLAIVASLAIWIPLASLGPEDLKGAMTVLFLLTWVSAMVSFPVLSEISNRTLLASGELAVGRVVQQETVQQGRSTWSAVFYAFVDGGNRGYIGRGTDFSDSLAPGAPVIVYYDALDPNKNIAMECSRLTVNST
jgi:hypothetical protein